MFKSKLFLTVVAAGLATAVFAQPYVQVQAGYAFATSADVRGTTNVTTGTGATAVTTSENIYGTGGSGIGFGAAFGYGLSEHISAQLGVAYGINSQVTAQASNADAKTSSKTTSSGTQLRLIPALVLSTGKEGLAPYARFGLILPVAGTGLTTIEATTATGSSKNEYTSAGQFSVGFNSALGVAFNINDKIAIFGEAEVSSLTIKGKSLTWTKGESTDASGKVTNSLENAKAASTVRNYVDKLDGTTKDYFGASPTLLTLVDPTYDQSKASTALAPMSNNNSVGINIGVRIKF